jgi:hypothetical protein
MTDNHTDHYTGRDSDTLTLCATVLIALICVAMLLAWRS